MIGKMFVLGVLGAGMAMGQAPTASTPATPGSTTAASKPLAFDVVSVRQNISGGIHDDFGPTPDGYQMTNKSVLLLIMTAYVPQASGATLFTNNILGFPDWAGHDNYDVSAKVSEADLTEWQKPASQPLMLRAMLQAMLEDRFKLVVHREMKEVAVYSLVVGKNGPKFKETDPANPHTGGLRPPGGGVMFPEYAGHSVHFYESSMAVLAPVLSSISARPVLDKTGLTGKYDFVLQRPESVGSSAAGAQEASDPGPTIFSVVEALGLKLEPAKGSMETLVIDHIEKPSAN